jgi:hypothetical protein
VPGGCQRRLFGSHAVEQFSASDEHDAGAGQRQHPSAISRIAIEVEAAPLDGAERDGIDHQPRFRAGLDLEKASDFFQHIHR